MASKYNPFVEEPELEEVVSFDVAPYEESQTPIRKPPDEIPPGWFGRRAQDITRGTCQIEEITGGGLYVLGKVTSGGLSDYGQTFARTAGRRVQIDAPRVGSLSNTRNFGDILEYGAEVFLEATPLFMASMIFVLVWRKLRRQPPFCRGGNETV